jgi:DNA mismatch repair ATPase MutS
MKADRGKKKELRSTQVKNTVEARTPFYGILSGRPDADSLNGVTEMPECFSDLNLDQVIDTITRGKERYELRPFFYSPLKDIGTIQYRHEVMRDLEDLTLLDDIRSFAQGMNTVREYIELSTKLSYKYQKERWFLDAVGVYCDVVRNLLGDLTRADVKSRGFLAFRDFLATYVSSNPFTSLCSETEIVLSQLSQLKYSIIIRGGSFTVRKYNSEVDYSTVVEKTFARFNKGATSDYRVKFSDPLEMNHIEAQILAFGSQLFPDVFHDLNNFCEKHSDFLDETIVNFDREIQFYIAYIEYLAPLKQADLKFCYPQLSEPSVNIPKDAIQLYDYECFDLALARKLVSEDSPVVCNDFYLTGQERIFVVTGPNQGGKTTFARMFGQLHYLASLGMPVPGRKARLSLFDQIFTHFEKQERMSSLRGKLEDDLIRIHKILEAATAQSIIIMNEIFTSTTLQDALFLSRNVLQRIIDLGCLAVCVTFIDELASMSDSTVSLASTVASENPALRTFKILRKSADGLAFAMSIAEKYRVTYEHLRKRLLS